MVDSRNLKFDSKCEPIVSALKLFLEITSAEEREVLEDAESVHWISFNFNSIFSAPLWRMET